MKSADERKPKHLLDGTSPEHTTKLKGTSTADTTTLRGICCETHGFMEQCVDLCLEITTKGPGSLRAMPSPDDPLLTVEGQLERGTLEPFAAEVLRRELCGAGVRRTHLLSAVCSLAREVAIWTRARDKRLH